MIDTHCHLHSQEFDNNRTDILSLLQQNNIQAILVGTSLEDSLEAIELSQEYKFLYPTLGIHPHEYENLDLSQISIDMEKILSTKDDIIALGECGFDFYYHNSVEVKDKQEQLFRLHLDMAGKYNKPVIIHTRDSFEDTYRVLSEYKDLVIILHCFTGDKDWVEKFGNLKLNIYFSFSGIITFKNAQSIQEAVKLVPIDKLLVETDAPYLAPVPHRGQQNTPLFLVHNIRKIANFRSVDYEELVQILDNNASQAFSI
ncbi:TatD family deoxyribonuclease [bacterium]|jgi:TatD DNase family protein|nr:TatD family deoxyribonuclease [Candidatus Elulimicrobium humile]